MFSDVFSTEIWTNTISIIGILYAVLLTARNNNKLINGTQSSIFTIIFIAIVTLYIGTRPIWCYADTQLYTTIFNLVQNGIWTDLKDLENEVFWAFIEHICLGLTTASGWLFVVACFYIIGMSAAAYRWFPRHFFLATIFLFTTLSFWGYATNGIRHGVATSICLLGLSFFMQNKKNFIIGYGFLIFGVLTHKSCLLILASATAALFFTNIKYNVRIWGSAILLGLLFQEQFKVLFASLIDDERMANYLLNTTASEGLFSTTGIRWDFILYSSVPIILGWYIIVYKKIQTNKTYIFLLSTYIFANAFWLLINSVAYSNRFAYLSWFLYPIILIYPLCKFYIFKRQGITLGIMLISSIVFTYIMQ